MNQNHKPTFVATTPEDLLFAILMGQNSFLDRYRIRCRLSGTGHDMMQEFQTAHCFLHDSAGGFPASQLKDSSQHYWILPSPSMSVNESQSTYLCSAKEANDARCVAAEIGTLLRRQLGEDCSLRQIVRAYQDWINRFFRYENKGMSEDHSAFGLLKNRTGVCQAIAAVSVLILPYLGLDVHYVHGDGLGAGGWGNHAWNLIRFRSGPWIHVDFTFGLNALFTPGTFDPLSEAVFRRNHRWSADTISPQLADSTTRLGRALQHAPVLLTPDHKDFYIGKVKVITEKPIFYHSPRTQDHQINLFFLLSLLGGGCEYLPDRDLLRICLTGRQRLIDHASDYLSDVSGVVSSRILNRLPVAVTAHGRGLQLVLQD